MIHSLSDLTIRGAYALFWGAWPSNWTISPFTLDGVLYNCVEKCMMAEKARLFGDTATLEKILATNSPAEQKGLGRQVKGFNEARWAEVRYDVVVRATIEKYRQNPELGALLKASGNLKFVEASPKDCVWGIGLTKTDPDAIRPERWRGQNLLGKAIDEARKYLREEAEDASGMLQVDYDSRR